MITNRCEILYEPDSRRVRSEPDPEPVREEEAVFSLLVRDMDSGLSIAVPNGGSLLEALENAAQESVPVGCRNGGCGVCRIRVLSGSFRKGRMSSKYVTADQARERIALACRVYPTSALVYRKEPLIN